MEYAYCPQCGAEYRPGFSRCTECDVDLVDERPSVEQQARARGEDYYPALDPRHPDYVYRESDWVKGIEPVVVYEAIRDIDAEVALSVLRAHDLRVFSAGTGLQTSYGSALGHGGMSSIRIMAHPDDAAEARSLLQNTLTEPDDEEAYENEEDEYGDDGEDRAPLGGMPTRSVAWFVLVFGFLPGGLVLLWLLNKILG